jgi:hypothetical protein
MAHYERQHAAAQALAAYERLRTQLAARQRSMPAPETQSLYARIKAAAGA